MNGLANPHADRFFQMKTPLSCLVLLCLLALIRASADDSSAANTLQADAFGKMISKGGSLVDDPQTPSGKAFAATGQFHWETNENVSPGWYRIILRVRDRRSRDRI